MTKGKGIIQRFNFKNVFTQALKPTRLNVMLRKIWRRVADQRGLLSDSQNMEWIYAQSRDFTSIARMINPELWREAEEFQQNLEDRAHRILSTIEYNLGGGGIYPLLYFITRLMVPEFIVETGVAAGYSSYAFLSAISRNRKGILYSSDFPYFRLPNPEQYIGILVDNNLKSNWRLFIEGDESNLFKILKEVRHIDIFHYDSDKSYSGRAFALSLIRDKMSERGIILMDDIQDNSYFYDYIQQNQPASWYVFEFQGSYVGMIGEFPGMS